MPRDCATCGTRNPDEARFCFSCAAPFDPKRGRRERKFAAVLFADLVGYTSLSERSDPEVVRSLVARTFDRFSEVIQRHGGVTEKFMGDAVLAVFGVPAAHGTTRYGRCALRWRCRRRSRNSMKPSWPRGETGSR